ncbi:MAG: DNA alkylation repair protein [Pseudomonadota bacterium]
MSVKAETGFSLKDDLFNRETTQLLAESVAESAAERPGGSNFSAPKLIRTAGRRFPKLELKERIFCLVDLLEQQLPSEFPEALEILRGALPPPLDPELSDDDFGRFIWVVPGEYVARHGCTEQHLDRSLDFLREATMRFSSELAIRPFLAKYPKETLAQVRRWTKDPNYHVRRLASEGIRPLLPWAMRVVLPSKDVVQVLDQLYRDKTRYVVRSVANNLNDMSKLDPDLLLATLKRWQRRPHPDPAEMRWLTGHALRSLVKGNHVGALKLLGYPDRPKVDVAGLEYTDQVPVGEALQWRATLKSRAKQRLKIFLQVDFLKNDGSHKAKMFTLKDIELQAGESIELKKRLPFRPMTTRTLYPGTHFVSLVVNGTISERQSFQLTLT